MLRNPSAAASARRPAVLWTSAATRTLRPLRSTPGAVSPPVITKSGTRSQITSSRQKSSWGRYGAGSITSTLVSKLVIVTLTKARFPKPRHRTARNACVPPCPNVWSWIVPPGSSVAKSSPSSPAGSPISTATGTESGSFEKHPACGEEARGQTAPRWSLVFEDLDVALMSVAGTSAED